MWAQTFSYTQSNKTLTIGVTEDLSNDNDAAGKVQTDILYRIDDKITITTLTLALLLQNVFFLCSETADDFTGIRQ